ncbi:MAG: outer membrane protein transport protein [Myxococcales bacterium]|nr:outer membrane protein transport protein [Myxococcales bacterium]MCB9522652.1 outer membrane protein transport protein [Myxococcales bacterium]
MTRRSTAAVALATCLLGGGAWANPFYVGRYRGLAGGPVDESGWNVYWNPAGIAEPGARVALSLQVVGRQGTYDKPAELNGIPPEEAAANAGFNETGALGLLPAMAGTWGWDLGDFVLGVGGAVFVARAGTANWAKKPGGPAEFPGAYDGPQRWATINTFMAIVSTGVGLGVSHRPTGLSVGVTPVANFATLSTVRARNLDTSEDLFQPDGRLKEGRILLEDATDMALTWIAGMRWDAADWFGLGLTWHAGHTYDLRGRAYIQAGDDPEQTVDAKVPLPVAHTVRGGLWVAPVEWLVLRPEFEWSNWSVMDEQTAVNNSPNDPGYGDALIPLARDFDDTWATNLKLDVYDLVPHTVVHLGGGYETGATPTRTHEPGLAEADSFNLGLGFSVALPYDVGLSVSYILHQFMDVTVTDSIQKPTTNGTYTDRRHYLTVDLEFAFGSDDDRAPSPFPRRDPGEVAAHDDAEGE